MQASQRDQSQQAVRFSERRPGGHIRVHYRVQEQMRECSQECTEAGDSPGYVWPRIAKESQREFAYGLAKQCCNYSNYHRTGNRVAWSMQHIVARYHPDSRFDINQNLGPTENHEAESVSADSLEESTWPEMKGCKWQLLLPILISRLSSSRLPERRAGATS